jgi:hypothetical protein
MLRLDSLRELSKLRMLMTTVTTAVLGEAPIVGGNGGRRELGFLFGTKLDREGKNLELEFVQGTYTALVVVDDRPGQQRRPGRGGWSALWCSPARRASRDEEEDPLLALIRTKRYTGWAGPWCWVAPWTTVGLRWPDR